MSQSKICLVGIPSCLGGNKPGCEHGPAAIRRQLSKELPITDLGDITPTEDAKNADTKDSIEEPYAHHLSAILALNAKVRSFLQKHPIFTPHNFPVLLGGDHSVNYEFIRAATKARGPMGLIWFDAHGDFNTTNITPSGNIHGMILAAIAGRGLNKKFGNDQPLIAEKNICIVGARALDPQEKELLAQTNVTVYPMSDIHQHGLQHILTAAFTKAAAGTNGIHLSIDLDVFDPTIAPGVGTPVPGGLSTQDMLTIVKTTTKFNVTSMGVVEHNPTYDQDAKTAILAAELIDKMFKMHQTAPQK